MHDMQTIFALRRLSKKHLQLDMPQADLAAVTHASHYDTTFGHSVQMRICRCPLRDIDAAKFSVHSTTQCLAAFWNLHQTWLQNVKKSQAADCC